MIFNNALDLRIGAVGASKAYLGSTLVWPSGSSPDTGSTPTGNSARIVSSLTQITSAGTYALVNYQGQYVKDATGTTDGYTIYKSYGDVVVSGGTTYIPGDALYVKIEERNNPPGFTGNKWYDLQDNNGNHFSMYRQVFSTYEKDWLIIENTLPDTIYFQLHSMDGGYYPSARRYDPYTQTLVAANYGLYINPNTNEVVFDDNQTHYFLLYKLD